MTFIEFNLLNAGVANIFCGDAIIFQEGAPEIQQGKDEDYCWWAALQANTSTPTKGENGQSNRDSIKISKGEGLLHHGRNDDY